LEAASAAGGASPADAFRNQLLAWQARMERALAARLPDAGVVPERLHAAMRYSVLGGGKRIRPALLFATARTLGLGEDQVEAAACAIELVHAYSLVHDDLPAMDNDDLRRGRPTCHKAFDEATAILVGDALQALAFEWLARDGALPASSGVRLQLIGLLAEGSGSFGMAGGQAIDMAAQGRVLDLAGIEQMHARKTGALIRVSVLMAADCVPELDPVLRSALASFAAAIGLAFQIQDDLLDVLGESRPGARQADLSGRGGYCRLARRGQHAAPARARIPATLWRARRTAAVAIRLAARAAQLTASAGLRLKGCGP
jgi:geranylgeranyl pyrophosphate synthase